MVMRLDRRVSESALVRRRFRDYGILEKCLKCPIFDNCKTPQYEAPGLKRFICKDPRRAAAIRAAKAKKAQPRTWEGPGSSPRIALKALFSRGKIFRGPPRE